MLDLKKLRENPDIFKKGVASKSPKAATLRAGLTEFEDGARVPRAVFRYGAPDT